MREKPKEERERAAKDETSDNGKIEHGVLGAMDDIAGKPAKAEWKFAAKIEQTAGGGENDAEKQQNAAEIASRVHGDALTG
jgi:hypothetical protein